MLDMPLFQPMRAKDWWQLTNQRPWNVQTDISCVLQLKYIDTSLGNNCVIHSFVKLYMLDQKSIQSQAIPNIIGAQKFSEYSKILNLILAVN